HLETEEELHQPRIGLAEERPPGRLATAPPGQHHVEAFLSLRVERGDQARRILQVAIHYHRPVTPRLGQTGGDRGVLAEVAAQPEATNPWVAAGQLLD